MRQVLVDLCNPSLQTARLFVLLVVSIFPMLQVYDVKLSSFSPRMWRDLRVGDVICVSKGENFPADLLFLGSDHEEGICYIETMQLDGETNLKIKKALDETKSLDEAALARLRIIATCEPPNSRLYQFTGKVEVNVCGDSSDVSNVSSSNNAAGNHSISIAGEESKFAGEESKDSSGEATVLPLSPAAVLLRGCSLCNTGRVYGMIMYAGVHGSRESASCCAIQHVVLVAFLTWPSLTAAGFAQHAPPPSPSLPTSNSAQAMTPRSL